jgi:hypothetical protein
VIRLASSSTGAARPIKARTRPTDTGFSARRGTVFLQLSDLRCDAGGDDWVSAWHCRAVVCSGPFPDLPIGAAPSIPSIQPAPVLFSAAAGDPSEISAE